MAKRSGKRSKKAAPVAQGSKRRQFNEYLQKILGVLKQEDGFQEAEELIAELKGWAGNYLSALFRQIEETGAEERLDLLHLVAYLEEPEAIPHLERLIFEVPVDVAAKSRAAGILDELGAPLEVGMAESLRNAAAILQGIPNVRPESFHGSHPLFVKFVQLPSVLRQATLIELAASNPPMAVHFIELLRSREPRPHRETIAALVLLETPQAVRILEEYQHSATDKETLREVRRALYRLESRGVQRPGETIGAKENGQAIFRPLVVPAQGFMSLADGNGTRVIWLAKPIQGGGRLLYQAVVNDERGLLDFSAVEVSLRSFRSYMEEITARDLEFPVAEVPPGYAARGVVEGHRRVQERGGDIPRDYPIHRRSLEELASDETPDWSGLRGALGEKGAGGTTPEAMEAFLERPEFATWVLDPAALEPFLEELKALLGGQLVVSRGTRQVQVDEVCRKTAASLFDETGRDRWVRRLEDTAYVLWRSERPDAARTALAVADTLREEGREVADHPFVQALVRRSVASCLSVRPEEEGGPPAAPEEPEEPEAPKEPSLIITPDDIRREQAERMARRSGGGGGPRIITP